MDYRKWKVFSYALLVLGCMAMLLLVSFPKSFTPDAHNTLCYAIVAAFVIGLISKAIFIDPHEPYLTARDIYGKHPGGIH